MSTNKPFKLSDHVEFIESSAAVFGLPEIFAPQLTLLTKASIKPKPSWFPFKEFSTTIGNTIYIADTFHSWTLSDRCQNLLHEATHLQQWQRYGYLKFSALYSIDSKRCNLEAEAYTTSVLWYVVSGSIKEEANPNRYVFHPRIVATAQNIQKHYKLNIIDNKFLIERFVSAVVKTFEQRRRR